MKFVIRPALDPGEEIDVTESLVAAIAAELARRCGGNDRLNWLEAERHLERLVGGAAVEGGVRLSVLHRPGDRVLRHERWSAKRYVAVPEVARG